MARSRAIRAGMVGVLVTLTAAALSPGAQATTDPARPNILFIVTDDQRAGTVEFGPGGSAWMDKAKQWFPWSFENAYTTTPMCCPARASIFTGRYVHNHKGYENAGDMNQRHADDPATPLVNEATDVPTLQWYLGSDAMLRENNGSGAPTSPDYSRAIFGKYLNAWVAEGLRDPNTGVPGPPDFDEWGIFDNGPYYPDPSGTGDDKVDNWIACPKPSIFSYPLLQGMNCVNEKTAGGPAVFKDEEVLRAELPAAERDLEHPPSLYSTTYIRNKAEDFLRRHAGPDATPEADSQPWFLYLAPTAPHRGGPQAAFKNSEVVDAGDADVPVPPYPYSLSDPAVEALRSDRADKPPPISDWASLTDFNIDFGTSDYTYQDAYTSQLRMLKSVDRMVDGVMSDIQAWEPGEPTIAFFISDNGLNWGEHTLHEKGVPYEDAVHVPLRMWAQDIPKITAAGLQEYSYKPTANVDLVPTLFDVMNVAPNVSALPQHKPLDGRSLLGPPRSRLLLEGYGSSGSSPLWTSTLVPDQPGSQNGYQYIENRILPPLPPLPAIFSEYYTGGDMPRSEQQYLYAPSQLRNVFGSDGVRQSNELNTSHGLQLVSQLDRDRRCSGTTPGSSPPPCP